MRLSHCEACDVLLSTLHEVCVCVLCSYMFTCLYVSVHVQGQVFISLHLTFFFWDKVLHWSWRLLFWLNCLNTVAQRSSWLCPTLKIKFPRLYHRVASHTGRMQFLQVFLLQISVLTWESDALQVDWQWVAECSQLAPGFFNTRCFQTSWGLIQVRSLLVFNSSLERKQWVSLLARC